ncbi:MAG TPA: metallophosphoesterase [Polyangia bacterium]
MVRSPRRQRCLAPSLTSFASAAILILPLACGGISERRPVSKAGGNSDTAGVGYGGSGGSELEAGEGGDVSQVGDGGNGGNGGKEASTGGAVGEASDLVFELRGTPLPFAPTAHGFGLNVVLARGDPSLLRARVRAQGVTTFASAIPPEVRGTDIAQWNFEGLAPGVHFEYEILASIPSGDQSLYLGSVVTQRQPGDSFTFALITDSHIGADLTFSNQGIPNTLKNVSAEAGASQPDFIMNLGDMLDFHEYGFNTPPPSASVTRLAYLNYRTLLGDTLGHAAHYGVIGNWEGEDGCYTAEETSRSQQQRLLYLPGPTPTTYPEGGSPSQDYYAFTWGDALFVVLNVMGYTPTPHLLDNSGVPDDWTLGEAQLGWFGKTLANATAKWRFVLIHHTVGGAAGDAADSAYGRGGGRAAYVGEQAKVHQLMLQHGVQIFFYGHDHVFTDMQVDGIHYTLPGSAGAPWLFGNSLTGYSQSWLESGWSKVTVSPDGVDVQFLKMGGGLLYEYTLP